MQRRCSKQNLPHLNEKTICYLFAKLVLYTVAGMNPFEMKGKNVAVLVTMDTSEAITIHYHDLNVDGFGMIGHSKTMIANRLSYFLNFTGNGYWLH